MGDAEWLFCDSFAVAASIHQVATPSKSMKISTFLAGRADF
jgi:hypothetical protein